MAKSLNTYFINCMWSDDIMSVILLGLLLALFSTILILVHKKSLVKTSPLFMAASYSFINLIFALILIPWVNFNFDKRLFLLVYSISWLGLGGFYYISAAIKKGEISSVEPLGNLEPILVAFLAFVILGETITRLQIFGIFLIVLGSYNLETRHFTHFKETINHIIKSKYIYFIFVGLLLYGFSSIGDKVVLGHNVTPITYLFMINFCIGFNNLIIISLRKNGFKEIKKTFKTCGKWILFASCVSIILRLTQFIAFTLGSIAIILSLKRVSGLFSVIIGGELFHEHNLKKKIISSLIMIFGVILVTVG